MTSRCCASGLRSGLVVVVCAVLWCLICPTGATAVALEPGPDPIGVWPLLPEPEVLDYFDAPDTPYGPGHRGVDLAGTMAQPVRSALPGIVSYAGRIAGRGVVVVSHGATRTTYEPVIAAVGVGDPVAAGQRIGVLELAGSHCFPRV